MAVEPTVLYVCGCCFSADVSPGDCPRCRQPRLCCDLGAPDNPCRRPPMDAAGRLLCRAPLWWVRLHAPHLARKRA
jgi:hypothetical protein